MIFLPQVDLRILRAISIEHEEDINEAIEFILSEVLPATTTPDLSCILHEIVDPEQELSKSKFASDLAMELLMVSSGAELIHNVILYFSFYIHFMHVCKHFCMEVECALCMHFVLTCMPTFARLF